MAPIGQLLNICSQPLGPPSEFKGEKGLLRKYLNLLNKRNGFYAFESALLFRPGFVQSGLVLDSRTWNDATLWKEAYGTLQPTAFFFAEDIFGNQFGIESGGIVRFDVETGEVEAFSKSLKDWVQLILDDFEFHTGYPIARDWQARNGAMEPGTRLAFRQPLVLGGEICIDNLICWNDLKLMRARGALAQQIKDVPDGSQVIFKYTE